MCKQPMIPDPYEQLYVQVRQSKMKGGGEGLFSRKNVPENTPLAFYNGIKLTSEEVVLILLIGVKKFS